MNIKTSPKRKMTGGRPRINPDKKRIYGSLSLPEEILEKLIEEGEKVGKNKAQMALMIIQLWINGLE